MKKFLFTSSIHYAHPAGMPAREFRAGLTIAEDDLPRDFVASCLRRGLLVEVTTRADLLDEPFEGTEPSLAENDSAEGKPPTEKAKAKKTKKKAEAGAPPE